jgi:hypothetical protein
MTERLYTNMILEGEDDSKRRYLILLDQVAELVWSPANKMTVVTYLSGATSSFKDATGSLLKVYKNAIKRRFDATDVSVEG